MATKRFEQIGKHTIFFDQMYFIAYAGGSRKLTKDKQKTWDKTLQLPGLLQAKERAKIDLIDNPNLVPIKGVDLVSFIRELGYIPFLDGKGQNILQLTDVLVYKSILQQDYKVAMK